MMMMKEKYERTVLEITAFQTEDVIVTSGVRKFAPNDPYEDTILRSNR